MKICILTTRHISYNPRVVKEADALAERGHEVTVIAIRNRKSFSDLDDALMRNRSWRWATVDYRKDYLLEYLSWLWMSCIQRGFQYLLSRITLRYGIAEIAQGREYIKLKNLACCHNADLYIAHHVESLGAAYAAAKKHRSRLGFDVEDLHEGQFEVGESQEEVRRIEFLEEKYLPHCDYVTTASPCFNKVLSKKYRVSSPTTVLNTFPLEKLDSSTSLVLERASRPSLYWYSQVIGPGRGLETLLKALGKMNIPVDVHLRGKIIDEFDKTLYALAEEFKVAGSINFHEPVPPDELIQYASCYDVGLALEQKTPINRDLCVTNKILTYLNAGLAILATDTVGQQIVMNEAVGAGALCASDDPQNIADKLQYLVENPERLAQMKMASRKAAESIFNWELEKIKLIAAAESVKK